ncbi:ABC transporter permease [Heyndrickxia acidiproducens]|uniref:ABC transporter permease n=1 Tax=Heyndrickxia acidiproducens TaxID=1121084 RepID=UPI00036DCD10|nr:ABC transporter permease [Heyndrickxia acidiproducens]
MKSAITIIKEQVKSFYLIMRLSLYEVRSENRNNYLGILWEVINPMIQLAIYWFVFGFGLRGGNPRPEYVPWLFAGSTIWFFINPAVLQGSRSIYSRIRMVAKMNFPMSAIPSYVIMSKFYQHMLLLAIVVIILQFQGYPVSVYYLELPYYMVCAFIFTFSLSLVTSTLATIVRDVQNIMQAIMRMMIYILPVLWNPSTLKGTIATLLKMNPYYYIVEGYRSALLGNTGWYLIEHWHYSVYFWGATMIVFIIGSVLHNKFRNSFVDFL